MYIHPFLNFLWNSPEIMYHILVNTETEAIESNLASLVVNNFYSNFLSGDYMENNLLYIITMLLKDEIEKLESLDQVDSFLEKTKCGFILEELKKTPDIQIYFTNVVRKTVEKIERNYSFREIKFNIQEISKELLKFKSDEEKKLSKKNRSNNNANKDLNEFYNKMMNSQVRESCINYQENNPNQMFDEKYGEFVKKYMSNITIKEFESRSEQAKNDNKENLFNYYKKLENDITTSKDDNRYSNSLLISKMEKTNLYNYIMSFYHNDFLEVTTFLKQLIEDLKKNILLLPNSIKYICKIISILIKKKFKDATQNDINKFISRFVIEKLLIPIISMPNFNALISDFVISGITVKNIKIINFILKKLFSGGLFLNNESECDYTPFNWIFMENIDVILKFFDKTTNVNLPEFIVKYINDELPKDFCYKYFEENKEDFYANISICFNMENIYHLANGILKDKSILDRNFPNIEKFRLIMNKFKPEEILKVYKIKTTKENDEKEKLFKSNTISFKDDDIKEKQPEKEPDCVNYFIYNDKVIEDSCINLFTINNIIANFYIDVKKKEKKRKDKNKEKLNEKDKIIIKVKNYLSNSLGNYRLLNRQDFHSESTKDTVKMLKEIKNYMFLPNFIINNNTIPSIWFIDSLLDYIDKLPEDYRENDFKKLFNELTRNLNKSINNLDFEKLILFRNKLKFIDKNYNYYLEVRKLINNIVINENIKHIVEGAFIPVDICFFYDDKIKKFELIKSKIKDKSFGDKLIQEDFRKNFTSFRTIEAFTRYFPNISKYQTLQDINPLSIIRELKINEGINHYFAIIKEKIIKKELMKEKKYCELYEEKMKNYIMNKIHEKLYPSEPSEIDIQLLKKITSLSWVEPFQIIKKVYIFDNMLPDILNEFKQINIVKTPYKKLNCCQNILKSVINLIQFNEGMDKEVGSDDITPVLNYISIKANPFKIHTDIEYTKLFSENDGLNENSLVNLEAMFNYILNVLDAKSLGLTEEEFNQKVKETNYKEKCDNFIYSLNN